MSKFGNLASALADETKLNDTTRKILSLGSLLLAAVIGFMTFTGTKFFFFTSPYSLQPDLISAPIAIAVLVPLYARQILRWSVSVHGIIMLILYITVFSSIVNHGLNGKFSTYLFGAAIVLSWLGMRGVAGLSWVLLIAAAIMHAADVSSAMGFYGFLLVASAFLGLLLHSDLSPDHLFNEIKSEFSPKILKAKSIVETDVGHLGDITSLSVPSKLIK